MSDDGLTVSFKSSGQRSRKEAAETLQNREMETTRGRRFEAICDYAYLPFEFS